MFTNWEGRWSRRRREGLVVFYRQAEGRRLFLLSAENQYLRRCKALKISKFSSFTKRENAKIYFRNAMVSLRGNQRRRFWKQKPNMVNNHFEIWIESVYWSSKSLLESLNSLIFKYLFLDQMLFDVLALSLSVTPSHQHGVDTLEKEP